MDVHGSFDVAVVDLPGAFLYARFDATEMVCMQLEGIMADAIVQIALEINGKYLFKN